MKSLVFGLMILGCFSAQATMLQVLDNQEEVETEVVRMTIKHDKVTHYPELKIKVYHNLRAEFSNGNTLRLDIKGAHEYCLKLGNRKRDSTYEITQWRHTEDSGGAILVTRQGETYEFSLRDYPYANYVALAEIVDLSCQTF